MSASGSTQVKVISSNTLAFLIDRAQSLGLDPSRIVEGTGLSWVELHEQKSVVPSSILYRCLENAAAIWPEKVWSAMGSEAFDSPAFRELKTAALLMHTPQEVYRWSFTQEGPGFHQELRFFKTCLEESGPDLLVLEMASQNGYPFPRHYARFIEGMLSAYPKALGFPATDVRCAIHDHGARYNIRFPRQSGPFCWLRRKWARFRALRAAIKELPEAHALLQERFKELNAQRWACEAAQAALQESEERYRTLVEYSPDAIVVVDVESGLFIDANGNAEQLFGLDRATLLTRKPEDLSAPLQSNGRDSKTLAREYIETALHGRHPVFEWIHRNASGRDIVCEVRLARLPDGGRRLVRASVTDIRQRKRAEAELRRLVTAIAAAGEAILITDPQGRIQYTNPAFETQTGFKQEEALGKTPAILKSGYQDEAFYQAMWGAIQRGEVWRGALFNRRKNGDTYNAELTIAPVFDDSGAIMNFVAVSRDVSRRKRAEETIAEQQMKMIASSRLATLGVMSASIAHEIKNPLAVISGYAEQLAGIQRRDYPDRADCALIVDSIGRNAKRIARIIDGLQSLAREGSQNPFTVGRVRNIVADTLELCRARFLPGRIGLMVDEIPEDLAIECRVTQIAQVLLNLLANALDAVRDLPEPWVRIGVQEIEDQIEIRVTDSGNGLPETIREAIFEQFFTTKNAGQGLGLGLSISRGIIEAHKGVLTVDASCPNTSFIVRLPRRQPQHRNCDDSRDCT